MKRILGLFYRLAYVIFGVWAIAEFSAFNLENFVNSFTNINIVIDLILVTAIFLGFIFFAKSHPPKWFYVVKSIITLFAVWMILTDWQIFLLVASSNWIILIFLPAMAILDWILFDQKGELSLKNALISLLSAFLALALLGLLGGALKFNLNSLPDWLELLGMLSLSLSLMCLVDYLLSKGLKHPSEKVCLILRIFFLIAEGWAFFKLSGGVLLTLFYGFKYFSVIINACAFLCIAVQLIQLLINKSNGKNTASFLRIKGGVMLCMTLILLYTVLFQKIRPEVQSVTFFHGILAPAIFIIDWFLFDKKGTFKGFDPFLWLIVPAIYYVATGLILKSVKGVNLYPVLYSTPPLILIGAGVVILLTLGYIYYILDIIMKRK